MIRRYEELLGLPANQLVAVVDTMYRYARPAGGACELRRKVPAGGEALGKQQQLLDVACSNDPMSGSDWDSLTWLLCSSPYILPRMVWTDLANRLLSEMIISDGVRWHQRYEAFNRILNHAVGQFAAIDACVSLGRDRSNQVAVETVSALDFSRHVSANAAVLRELQNPTSDQSQRGALLACFRKVEYGHFSPLERRRLVNVLYDLSRNRYTSSSGIAGQILRLVEGSTGSEPTPEDIGTGRMMEREIIARRVTSAILGATRCIPESFADPILPVLVREMLFGSSWDIRLMATSLLAVSPYRDGVSAALFDEFKSERTLLGDPEWPQILLSALRFVGGIRERRLLEQIVVNGGVPFATTLAASYSIGHIVPTADLRPLEASIELHIAKWTNARSAQSAAILSGLVYSAGISGALPTLSMLAAKDRAPRPLIQAATWWLNLPGRVVRSISV